MTVVFLVQLYLAHGKHPGNYETLCPLLEILTLSLSPHPKNEELTHPRYHDTEIIQGVHHHFSEEPTEDIKRKKFKKFIKSFLEMIFLQKGQKNYNFIKASVFQGKKRGSGGAEEYTGGLGLGP